MFKKIFLVALLSFVVAVPVFAQEAEAVPMDEIPPELLEQLQNSQPEASQINPDEVPPDQFYRARVIEVVSQDQVDTGQTQITTQILKVKFTTGELKDQEKELSNDGVFTINGGDPLEVGQVLLIYKTAASGTEEFYIADTYRVPSLMYMVASFFVLAVALSRWKGVASILGLLLSILVIIKFIIPQIIDGKNPLVITLLGALMIALVSIYLAHGFNRRTSVALVSTLITLGLSAVLAIVFVNVGHLFGLGSEEAFYVQQLGSLQDLNLKGLLLGGIILGALGVLDDITTAQTATIYELKRANADLGWKELFVRGLRVGREHVNSLVNTLFLAYAGASLPLFLFFTVGGSTQPLWVTLNSEFIAEEIVRTLVGSMGLMMAVPITTFLAAYYFGNRPIDASDATPEQVHTHSH